jgi:transposase
MDYKEFTADELQELVNQSHSWDNVLQKCGLKTMTPHLQCMLTHFNIQCEHLNDHFDGLHTKFNKKSKEELLEIIQNSSTWKEVMTKLNYHTDHFVPQLCKKLDKLQISYEHIIGLVFLQRTKTFGISKKHQYTLDEILVENSSYSTMPRLLKRLKNERGWEHKCSVCQLTEWNAKPIPLEIDHINGVHSDNRIENIRAICPNCHAQTDNYKGKNMKICKSKPPQPPKEPKEPQDPKPPKQCLGCNKEIENRNERCNQCNAKHKFETGVARKVQDRPSYEQLLDDIANMSIVKVGQKYGVSDNAIRKWIRKYEKYDETAKT